jgi:hypothetical protein
MFIEIDCDVSIPNEAPRVMRKRVMKDKIPASLKTCVRAFQEAYKIVYGVTPEVTVAAGYIRIKGQEYGVTRQRLKEMTNQLKWRAG